MLECIAMLLLSQWNVIGILRNQLIFALQPTFVLLETADGHTLNVRLANSHFFKTNLFNAKKNGKENLRFYASSHCICSIWWFMCILLYQFYLSGIRGIGLAVTSAPVRRRALQLDQGNQAGAPLRPLFSLCLSGQGKSWHFRGSHFRNPCPGAQQRAAQPSVPETVPAYPDTCYPSRPANHTPRMPDDTPTGGQRSVCRPEWKRQGGRHTGGREGHENKHWEHDTDRSEADSVSGRTLYRRESRLDERQRERRWSSAGDQTNAGLWKWKDRGRSERWEAGAAAGGGEQVGGELRASDLPRRSLLRPVALPRSLHPRRHHNRPRPGELASRLGPGPQPHPQPQLQPHPGVALLHPLPQEAELVLRLLGRILLVLGGVGGGRVQRYREGRAAPQPGAAHLQTESGECVVHISNLPDIVT